MSQTEQIQQLMETGWSIQIECQGKGRLLEMTYEATAKKVLSEDAKGRSTSYNNSLSVYAVGDTLQEVIERLTTFTAQKIAEIDSKVAEIRREGFSVVKNKDVRHVLCLLGSGYAAGSPNSRVTLVQKKPTVECIIGQRAFVDDVWYTVTNKRHGINELSGDIGNEYLLSSKDYWVPESWIQDVMDTVHEEERTMKMEWEKEGINYWENPDCPREYLEKSMVELVEDVEGTKVPANYFEKQEEADLRHDIGFYEYVADK